MKTLMNWAVPMLLILLAACGGPAGSEPQITDPPGEFSVTGVTWYCVAGENAGITLDWSASERAASFRVLRDGETVAELAGSARGFSDVAGLLPGTGTAYVVQAVNAGGTAEASTEPIAIPGDLCDREVEPGLAAPGPAIDLQAALQCSAQPGIEVTWAPVAAASNYRLDRDHLMVAETDFETTGYRDLDVIPGDTHTYVLRAINDSGVAISEPVSVMVPFSHCGLSGNVLQASGDTSYMVAEDGTVWAWGENEEYQLGQGDSNEYRRPVQVRGLQDIVSIASGWTTMLALDIHGQVWGFGANYSGQLGQESAPGFKRLPVPVPGLPRISRLASDGYFVLALAVDGTVWSWGDNWAGQLGNEPHVMARSEPVQIDSLENVVAVYAGDGSAFAVLADGGLMVWGYNGDGILGLPTDIESTHVPTRLAAIEAPVVSVAAGDGWTLALTTSGQVYGFGRVTGLGTGVTDYSSTPPIPLGHLPTVRRLAASSTHSLALLADGSVVGWGGNSRGQLGDGPSTESSPVTVYSGSDAVYVAAGYNFSLIMTADGRIHALGSNRENQLGWNTPTNYHGFVPNNFEFPADIVDVSAGGEHSLAVLSDHSVWAWGRNNFDQLGANGGDDSGVPVQVTDPGPVAFTAVAAGLRHSLALTEDGRVWSWGRNSDGELGLGHTAAVESPAEVTLPPATRIVAIAAGNGQSLALDEDGALWVWGNNSNGRLGNGNTTDQPTPEQLLYFTEPVTAVAAGNTHSTAVSDGKVFSWGSRTEGVMGNGASASGNQLTPVQSGSMDDVTAVMAGYRFTVALHADGSLSAWGSDTSRVIGSGSTNVPVAIEQLTDITALSSTYDSVLALDNNGTVFGWGSADAGEFGLPALYGVFPPQDLGFSEPIAQIASGPDFSLVVTLSGQLLVSGSDYFGQLGLIPRLQESSVPREITDLPPAAMPD